MLPGTVEPAPQINSLNAAISYLDGLNFAQPICYKSRKDRDQAFILNRNDVGDSLRDEVCLSSANIG